MLEPIMKSKPKKSTAPVKLAKKPVVACKIINKKDKKESTQKTDFTCSCCN